MNLIIETDLGSDPDDYFAILYLISAGVNIRALILTPGYSDQVAFGRFITTQLNLDIPIGTYNYREDKCAVNRTNRQFMIGYNYIESSEPDGYGPDIIKEVKHKYTNSEIFVIGPARSFGKYFKENPHEQFNRATIQGGFIGYDVHNIPCKRLKKFEGKISYPTFNLSYVYGAEKILEANINVRRFVSKNVNHTIVYTKQIHDKVISRKPENRAMELFIEGMEEYLKSHSSKKFHDPAAAVCHLHPSVAKWKKVKLYYKKGKRGYEWGSELNRNGDYIIVDINRQRFWDYIISGK